jgi:pentose-5-phosphate-3-epimerase
MKIIPAPEEPTVEGLSRQMTRLLPHFNRFSIDVQDGVAVPTKTAPISEIAEYLNANKILFKDVTFDFVIMIIEFKEALETLAKLSPDITIGNVVILSSALKNMGLPVIKELSIGLSVNIQDDIETIKRQFNLNAVPCIQIMTVYAGAQGQSLVNSSLNKVDQLRDIDYRNEIYIDGAVNNQTLPVILSRKNLPDFACVGSYLTKSQDGLEERVKYLKSVESGQV